MGRWELSQAVIVINYSSRSGKKKKAGGQEWRGVPTCGSALADIRDNE